MLIWNNQGYGEIKQYMVDREIPRIGVDIYTPDFQMLARGFGCHTAIAESYSHLGDCLREAVSADRPTVIEVNQSDIANWLQAD